MIDNSLGSGNLKSLLQLFHTLDDTMVVLLSKARTMPLNVLMMRGLLSFTKSYWVVTAVRMEGCHYFQTPNFSSFCPSHKWLFHVFRVLVGVCWKGAISLKRNFLTNLNQLSSPERLDLKVVGRNSFLSSLKTIKEYTQSSLKRFLLSLPTVKKKGKKSLTPSLTRPQN